MPTFSGELSMARPGFCKRRLVAERNEEGPTEIRGLGQQQQQQQQQQHLAKHTDLAELYKPAADESAKTAQLAAQKKDLHSQLPPELSHCDVRGNAPSSRHPNHGSQAQMERAPWTGRSNEGPSLRRPTLPSRREQG